MKEETKEVFRNILSISHKALIISIINIFIFSILVLIFNLPLFSKGYILGFGIGTFICEFIKGFWK